jgi:uncharacterized protein YaiE (UPF0345 family)
MMGNAKRFKQRRTIFLRLNIYTFQYKFARAYANGPAWITGSGVRRCSSHCRWTGSCCGAVLSIKGKSKLSFHLSIASEIHQACQVDKLTHRQFSGSPSDESFLSLTPAHRVRHPPIPQEWIANHGSYWLAAAPKSR